MNAHKVDSYIDSLKDLDFFKDGTVQSSFQSRVEFYDKHLNRARRCFRYLGTWVILGSILIPLFIIYKKDAPTLIAVISSSIALASSLQGFFTFSETWRKNTNAKLALERLKGIWDIEISKARTIDDQSKGLEKAYDATERFIRDTYAAINENAEGFFALQKFPNAEDIKPKL